MAADGRDRRAWRFERGRDVRDVLEGPVPITRFETQLEGELLAVESNPKLMRSRGRMPGRGSFSVGSSKDRLCVIGYGAVAPGMRSKRSWILLGEVTISVPMKSGFPSPLTSRGAGMFRIYPWCGSPDSGRLQP